MWPRIFDQKIRLDVKYSGSVIKKFLGRGGISRLKYELTTKSSNCSKLSEDGLIILEIRDNNEKKQLF